MYPGSRSRLGGRNKLAFVLGAELLASGAVALAGAATAATYNTATGEGTATRVDGANQSFVQFTGLSTTANYRMVVTNTGATSISLRFASQAGSVVANVAAGQTIVQDFSAIASGVIAITSSGGAAAFTVVSLKQRTP